MTALHVVEQALGVPMKRFERPMLGFLTRAEMMAVIGEPDGTWTSQRDHLLLRMLYNTGARVSEIIGVTLSDVVLDGAACVHLHGKGRKQRTVPLWPSTVRQIRAWLRRNPQLQPDSALLPNRDGQAMSRGNVTQRLALAVAAASTDPAATCPATHLAAHHPSHDGHASAAVGHRCRDARPVARAREPDDDPPVRRGRPGDESSAHWRACRSPMPHVRRYKAPDSLMEFLKTL